MKAALDAVMIVVDSNETAAVGLVCVVGIMKNRNNHNNARMMQCCHN